MISLLVEALLGTTDWLVCGWGSPVWERKPLVSTTDWATVRVVGRQLKLLGENRVYHHLDCDVVRIDPIDEVGFGLWSTDGKLSILNLDGRLEQVPLADGVRSPVCKGALGILADGQVTYKTFVGCMTSDPLEGVQVPEGISRFAVRGGRFLAWKTNTELVTYRLIDLEWHQQIFRPDFEFLGMQWAAEGLLVVWGERRVFWYRVEEGLGDEVEVIKGANLARLQVCNGAFCYPAGKQAVVVDLSKRACATTYCCTWPSKVTSVAYDFPTRRLAVGLSNGQVGIMGKNLPFTMPLWPLLALTAFACAFAATYATYRLWPISTPST